MKIFDEDTKMLNCSRRGLEDLLYNAYNEIKKEEHIYILAFGNLEKL